MTKLPESLRARVLDAARQERSPTRTERRTKSAIAIAIAACISLALFLAMGIAPLPYSYLALCGLGWTSVALALTGAALLRGKTMLGLPTRALAIGAIVGAPIVGAWVYAIHELTDVTSDLPPMKQHVACFLFAVVFSLAPLVTFAFLRRRSDPVHPRATGAILGAAAGAWGGLLIQLHCPNANPVHSLAGHVLPIVLCAIVGALVLPRRIDLR